jgi:eukaryotic-like serine/threonine-protein kinase
VALWKRRRRNDEPPREMPTVVVDNPWSVVLELASLRLESGDVEFAEEQFRLVMETGDLPSAAIAAFNLGQVLRRRGDLTGARDAYRRAVLADDLNLAGQSGINLAYVLKELGDRSGAEECLRAVMGAGHRDHGPRAAVELARMVLDDGRAEAATEVFRQVIATDHPVESAAASFYLAQLLAKRGYLDDAEETLAPVLGAGEGDFWAPGHLLLGEICRLRGDTSGARRWLAVARVHGDEQIAGMAEDILRRLPPEASEMEAEAEAGTEARSGSEVEPESEPESGSGVLTRLADGIADAQEAGRQGRTEEAVARYAELVHAAEGALGHAEGNTLAIRHQLAHWTGESGDAEGAVRLFERLLADRADLQGPDHPDTELARHQLAHWHGRAGRTEEAVRRYDELYRAAEAAGKTETALDLLCNVGYWQQEGGDTAAALRTFTQMLQTAERELGRDHEIAGIARQRYAELAGTLPFGHERGHDSLEDLIAATREVERSGDLRRAIRMHGQVAERCEQLYGAASEQTLNARKAQALAAVRAQEWTQASEIFQHVLDCLQRRGQGPGGEEYDQLTAQRDELARLGHKTYFRIRRRVGTLVANEVEPAPETAFGVLSRSADGTHAAHLLAIRHSSGGPGPHEMTEQQWDEVFRHLAEQEHRPLALYFARAGRRPSSREGALCERLGLLGVYVSREGADTVHMEAYAFRDGEPVEASVVVVPDEDGQSDPSQRQPGARMAFNPQAEALGNWREVKRARPARAADDPDALGTYEVLERVGEGGFGRVYLCRDADGMLVAVKTLHARHAADPDIRQGFADEVQAALRVSGRFTVPVITADTDSATPWLAVPYVAAPSLRELAERCGPLDEGMVRVLGAGIASALTAIHAEGIVHLDLKPGNVLLTQDGPRVIDFGIAQIEHLTTPRTGFTGTYGYASPEQLDGIAHFTPASDVFSLGTLIARLALGRSPWPGEDMMSVVHRIRSATPDLTGLPGGLQQVVRSCLSLQPADRPTPAEVAAALAPDLAADRIDPPPLPDAARELLDEYATLPAAHRLATLPYTQTHSARDTTAADPRAVRAEQTTISAPHAVSPEDTVRERRTADDDTTVPRQHTVTFKDSTVSGQRPVSEQTTVTAPASADSDHTVTAVTTVPSALQAASRDTTRDAASDLESRIRQWEGENEGKPLAQVRRECGAYSDEAHERLGAQHPLTLRLRVSHALLGLSDGPDAVARAEQVVSQAALHLGEGHPTVRDARAMLALLNTDQEN